MRLSDTIMDFESFAAGRNASRQDIGDPALHRSSSNVSDSARKEQLAYQAALDVALLQRRAELRAEFDALIADGTLREPTHYERIYTNAQGDPEKASVQAARRLLKKHFNVEVSYE